MSTWFVLYQVLCLLLTNSGHLYKYIAGHNFFHISNKHGSYLLEKMFKTQNVTRHIHRHIWSKIFLFVYVCVYVCISFMRNQQKRRWRMINWNRSRRRTSKFLSRVASSTQIHIMLPRSISTSVCCKIFTCCTSIISTISLDVMKIYMYIYESLFVANHNCLNPLQKM